MQRMAIALSALAISGCAVPVVGGMDPFSGMADAQMANSMAQMEAQERSMLAAQAAAQASASRPGDEAMSCDALQAEMTATMKDPQVTAAIASMGANAQSQMDRANAARAAATAGAAGMTAMSIAGSFIPGLNWFSQGAMAAQQAATAAQIPAANRDRAQMMTDITSVMPQLYRGQRLYEVALAKNCAFTQQPA